MPPPIIPSPMNPIRFLVAISPLYGSNTDRIARHEPSENLGRSYIAPSRKRSLVRSLASTVRGVARSGRRVVRNLLCLGTVQRRVVHARTLHQAGPERCDGGGTPGSRGGLVRSRRR